MPSSESLQRNHIKPVQGVNRRAPARRKKKHPVAPLEYGDLRPHLPLRAGRRRSAPGRSQQLLVNLEEIDNVAIRPLYDRVVVRRTGAETQTAGGIIIPDSAAEKSNQGEVVAVGPGAVLDNGATRAPAVAVGDRVLFGKYTPTEETIDGEELLIIRESDILAVIEHEKGMEKAA